MWLVRRLAPDFQTIAEFRRDKGGPIVAFRALVLIVGIRPIRSAAFGARRFEPPNCG